MAKTGAKKQAKGSAPEKKGSTSSRSAGSKQRPKAGSKPAVTRPAARAAQAKAPPKSKALPSAKSAGARGPGAKPAAVAKPVAKPVAKLTKLTTHGPKRGTADKTPAGGKERPGSKPVAEPVSKKTTAAAAKGPAKGAASKPDAKADHQSKKKTKKKSRSRSLGARSVAEAASEASADAQGYVYINGRRVRMISAGGSGAIRKARAARKAAEEAAEVQAVVKPSKTKLTAKELGHYRDILLEKRAELVGDVSAMEEAALRSRGDNLSNLPIHMADIGTDTFDQDFMLGLAETERKQLREIDEALNRIEDKTYGVCALTGNTIPKARLDAKPWAKYTIEAARLMEGQIGVG